MKSIRIKDSKDFDLLLEALVFDYVYAESIFRERVSLFYDLTARPKLFEAAKTFWTLTLRAHDDAVLLRLCRMYDQDRASLNLRRLLLTIKDNLHVFDEADFRQRFKGDPFVDSLAASADRPDSAQLDEDLQSMSNSDPLVAKLDHSRNRVIVHKDPRNILGRLDSADTNPLTEEDVTALLRRADTILNQRYRRLFKGNAMWRVIEGIGDYKNLLKEP
jgi:hypothetical protein